MTHPNKEATVRTDALQAEWYNYQNAFHSAKDNVSIPQSWPDFACTLERELTQSQSDLATARGEVERLETKLHEDFVENDKRICELMHDLESARQTISEQAKELESLREDKQRLDWLESVAYKLYIETEAIVFSNRMPIKVRTAIDAAIEKKGE